MDAVEGGAPTEKEAHANVISMPVATSPPPSHPPSTATSLVEMLSHKLVKTYQGINDQYYAAKASNPGNTGSSTSGGPKKRKKKAAADSRTDGRYVRQYRLLIHFVFC